MKTLATPVLLTSLLAVAAANYAHAQESAIATVELRGVIAAGISVDTSSLDFGVFEVTSEIDDGIVTVNCAGTGQYDGTTFPEQSSEGPSAGTITVQGQEDSFVTLNVNELSIDSEGGTFGTIRLCAGPDEALGEDTISVQLDETGKATVYVSGRVSVDADIPASTQLSGSVEVQVTYGGAPTD